MSLSGEVRRQSGRTAVRRCGLRFRNAARPLSRIEQLRLAPERLVAIGASTRELLAAPHRGGAPILDTSEQQDPRAAAVVYHALEELEQLGEERTPAAELIELLEGLQVPVHGPPPPGRC